ncbi:hypothetical protein IW262DRAFT_1300266 [Armillaria fumosa]|nr:hypothetical protein IW262DRAFT_1300266 [Armillaria fumosa]
MLWIGLPAAIAILVLLPLASVPPFVKACSLDASPSITPPLSILNPPPPALQGLAQGKPQTSTRYKEKFNTLRETYTRATATRANHEKNLQSAGVIMKRLQDEIDMLLEALMDAAAQEEIQIQMPMPVTPPPAMNGHGHGNSHSAPPPARHEDITAPYGERRGSLMTGCWAGGASG